MTPWTLFVTGTDTGVGKTHIAVLILRELRAAGLQVGAYKPVCSGAVRDLHGQFRWDDLDRLRSALPAEVTEQQVCGQRLLAPLAPPLAARAERQVIDVACLDRGLLAWNGQCDALVVEGAGGWLCPLTDTTTLADWATGWQFAVLVVARQKLGTINHTLLTIAAIRSCRLPVVGVVLTQEQFDLRDDSARDNAVEIEARSGVPVLGEVRFGAHELRQGERKVRIHWPALMRRLPLS